MRIRTTLASVVVAAVSIAVTGCGSGDGSAGGDGLAPTGGTSASPSSGPPTSGSSPAPTAPETSAAPTVAAATGPVLQLDREQLNAPASWTVKRDASFQLSAVAPGNFNVNILTLDEFPLLHDDATLEDLARETAKRLYFGRGEIESDVTVDGVRMAHLTSQDAAAFREAFVAIRARENVTISFVLDRHGSAADRRQLVGSVLSSVHWTS